MLHVYSEHEFYPFDDSMAIATDVISGANSYNRSLADHALHGWFCVLYPDGQVSQPFTFWTAWTYRKLFGGRILLKNTKIPSAQKG